MKIKFSDIVEEVEAYICQLEDWCLAEDDRDLVNTTIRSLLCVLSEYVDDGDKDLVLKLLRKNGTKVKGRLNSQKLSDSADRIRKLLP